MNTTTSSPPAPSTIPTPLDKSREVRLGVVMYGGVSLAIYIHGVSTELFNAVHGTGIYRLLKAITDSDIVVDVISGTSAGGINGIMLAYAICNDLNFTSASKLWREDGDIRKLLRSPGTAIDTCTSLLDSEEYYQSRLQEALRGMKGYSPTTGGEDKSPMSELDLFITGTDVQGMRSTQFDDAGHPIDVKDHRQVFQLKYRKGRKNQFAPTPSADNPTTIKALAKLARITSCFPAAFAPVDVRINDMARPEDNLLKIWGDLQTNACYLDGGVIDNKPFTYTTRAIFSRSADREVDRKLFYIDPDPEKFTEQKKEASLNFIQTILASMIGIPGYESITDDLKLLADHNTKIQQYRRLVDDLPTGGRPSDAQYQLYLRSRMIRLRDRVVQGLLKTNGRLMPLIDAAKRNKASEIVRQLESAEEMRKKVLDDFDLYYRQRRNSRIIYLIYDCIYRQKQEIPPELESRYRTVWNAFNRIGKIYEILEATMEYLLDEAEIEWDNIEPAELWQHVRNLLSGVMDQRTKAAQSLLQLLAGTSISDLKSADWLDSAKLEAFNASLKELATETVVNSNKHGFNKVNSFHSLLRILDLHEWQIINTIIADPNDMMRRAYAGFENFDAQIYPIELVAGLNEKDIIETVRISPHDANKGFSNRDFSDKVSGDTLYHFGGFFKRSWRSNDILWGRLDGLCQIVETLLKPDRIKEIGNDENIRRKVQERLKTKELDIKKLFPQSDDATKEALTEWLEQLFSKSQEQRARGLDKGTFDTQVALLIEAAQLEVLRVELPLVISDAIAEQTEWNRMRVQKWEPEKSNEQIDTKEPDRIKEPPYNPQSWSFKPGRGKFDALVTVTGAAQLSLQAVETILFGGNKPERPRETPLGDFFATHYRVGTEEVLRDIPSVILLEIVATSLIIMRNCLLTTLPKEIAERIRSNMLYKVLVATPLRLFYHLTILSRHSPKSVRMVAGALALLSTFALIVGIFYHAELITPRGLFSLHNYLVFIVIPISILLILALAICFNIAITGKLQMLLKKIYPHRKKRDNPT